MGRNKRQRHRAGPPHARQIAIRAPPAAPARARRQEPPRPAPARPRHRAARGYQSAPPPPGFVPREISWGERMSEPGFWGEILDAVKQGMQISANLFKEFEGQEPEPYRHQGQELTPYRHRGPTIEEVD